MNEEVKPGDVKRGVVAQREHRSGRVTIRDPKKVRLEKRTWDDEEWTLHTKYHTVADAEKAARAMHKREKSVPRPKYQIDGQSFDPASK